MSYGRVPFFAVLLLVISPTLTAEVYKWTDAEGNVHYGQSRPPGTDAEELEIEGPGMSAEQRELELDKLKLKAGLGSENENTEPRQAAAQMPKAVRDENCRIARQNVASLVQKRRIVQTDEAGNLVRLDDSERAARLQDAAEQVEEFCN